MNDMSAVIVPKSDQISADDLIAGPITIRITGVDIRPGTEQPVAISFDGDNGRPWKPCKSMSRVLVSAWGPDAKAYVGRSVTLYRDPKVKWGGLEVGGIRVSHLSNIERDMVMALTATKGKRSPYTVKVLAAQADRVADGVRALIERIQAGEDVAVEPAVIKQRAWLKEHRPELAAELDAAIGPPAAEDDPFAEGPADTERGDGFDVSADEIIAFMAKKARQEDVISLVASHAPTIMNMTEEDRERIAVAQAARIAEIRGEAA